MASSRDGAAAAAALLAATKDGNDNIRVTIRAEETEKLAGTAPTTANTTPNSTNIVMQVSGAIVAVNSNRSANTTANIMNTPTNLMDLFDPLLRNIISHLLQADLMNASLTSKRMKNNIPRATTYENRAPGTIIRVFHMLPSTSTTDEEVDDGTHSRLKQLMYQLQQLCDRDPNVLERYQHASMKDYYLFDVGRMQNDAAHAAVFSYCQVMKRIQTRGRLRIEGITSLNFCFSTLPRHHSFSKRRGTDFAWNQDVGEFSKNCPHIAIVIVIGKAIEIAMSYIITTHKREQK